MFEIIELLISIVWEPPLKINWYEMFETNVKLFFAIVWNTPWVC
jgi:hypothetical protein